MERLDKNQYGHLSQKIFEKTQTAVGSANISHIADGTITGALGSMGSRLDPNIVHPVIPTYEIEGADVFTSSWLSLTNDGEALTPIEGNVYEVIGGDYDRKLVYWNGRVYRFVGKMNVGGLQRIIPQGTQSHNINVRAYQGGGYGAQTQTQVILTARAETHKIVVSINAKNSMGSSPNAWIDFGGQRIITGWSQTATIDVTPEDAGKQLVAGAYCIGAATQTWSYNTGTAVEYRGYLDNETSLFVPYSAQTSDDTQVYEIAQYRKTQNDGKIPWTNIFRLPVAAGNTVVVSFSYAVKNSNYIRVGLSGENYDTLTVSSSEAYADAQSFMFSKTYNVTSDKTLSIDVKSDTDVFGTDHIKLAVSGGSVVVGSQVDDVVFSQAGLIPSAPSETDGKVLSSNGWDAAPLDITAEEIKTIFDSATGTTTTYNGTEFIIGEFGGKTLYESRLPLSDISGNNLNSFEFTAHKMIDGRVSLPTRLIDLSISKSGDQWAVSPVVSLSADEKQNVTLIIEYTKE